MRVLDIQPQDLIKGQRKRVLQKIETWLKQPGLRHRAWALAPALCLYLEQQRGELPVLRKNNGVRMTLGCFLAKIGSRAGESLRATLHRLQLEPIEQPSCR